MINYSAGHEKCGSFENLQKQTRNQIRFFYSEKFQNTTPDVIHNNQEPRKH